MAQSQRLSIDFSSFSDHSWYCDCCTDFGDCDKYFELNKLLAVDWCDFNLCGMVMLTCYVLSNLLFEKNEPIFQRCFCLERVHWPVSALCAFKLFGGMDL